MSDGPTVEEVVTRLTTDRGVLYEWRCTPADIAALALGRLYVEGRMCKADDLDIHEGAGEITITLKSAPKARGNEHPARNGELPDAEAFTELFRALFAGADERHESGGMHAAALAADGRIAFQAEDVGRHNAVDKVIGMALLAGKDPAEFGLLISSRVSGEIARKAARAGVAWLASRSIPTTLAVRTAREAGMPIVGRGRQKRVPLPMNVLGVVMAGGRNLRYGGLKAFADVGGTRIIDRVIGALHSIGDDIVVIANDQPAYESLGLPMRSDEVPSAGALGGLLTALRWSVERGHDGIVVVACDMPFASGGLLRTFVDVASSRGADVVVPESGGPRGVEPLCAFYSNRCLPAIDSAIERDDLRMIGFYADANVTRLGADAVQCFGDPAVLFMNVNTRDQLAAAETIATERKL